MLGQVLHAFFFQFFPTTSSLARRISYLGFILAIWLFIQQYTMFNLATPASSQTSGIVTILANPHESSRNYTHPEDRVFWVSVSSQAFHSLY